MHHPGIARRRVHFAHLSGVQSERLFAHHVLADTRCRNRHALMREVRRGNDQGIDLFIADDRFEVRRYFIDTPFPFADFQKLRIGVASGDQLGALSSRMPGT